MCREQLIGLTDVTRSHFTKLVNEMEKGLDLALQSYDTGEQGEGPDDGILQPLDEGPGGPVCRSVPPQPCSDASPRRGCHGCKIPPSSCLLSSSARPPMPSEPQDWRAGC